MVTILDVEKRCGVSKSTISRYLNGKKVSKKNKDKIEKAIKELDYHLNPLASGLKSNKTNTVGLITPFMTDQFFPPVFNAFEKYMTKNNYHIILNNYGNDISLEKKQFEILKNKRIDGMLIASGCTDGEHIKECLKNKIPVVLLDRLIPGVKCDSITVDNYQATFDAISLAIRKGHRKIAITRILNTYTDRERFRGYKDALEVNQLEFRKDYVSCNYSHDQDSLKRDFMHLLSLKDPPTLIFCSNIYLAAGALKAKLEYNIKIPQEVSVITFDRISQFPYYSFVSLIKPEFSSICQPLEEIGVIAARVLLNRIKTGMDNYKPENIELKTTFKMTESVADLN